MLDMKIGACQLSKLYAYNGLMLSGGVRVDGIGIDAPHRVIVVDNPEVKEHNVNVITVTDDIPKSFLLTSEYGMDRVYLCQVNAATLEKRMK